MYRVPQHSRVRRRLFEPDDLADQARVDNFANVLQESITRDRLEKCQKWNFDFENEVPLNGTYEWYPCTGTADWIGVKSEKIKADDSKEESFLPMKLENEVTPKTRDVEDVPLVRKRRKNMDVKTDNAVRRRISFE